MTEYPYDRVTSETEKLSEAAYQLLLALKAVPLYGLTVGQLKLVRSAVYSANQTLKWLEEGVNS